MSAFTLKVIALLSMLWDHVTYVFPVTMTLYRIFPSEAEVPLFDALSLPLAFIGRIAAPSSSGQLPRATAIQEIGVSTH